MVVVADVGDNPGRECSPVIGFFAQVRGSARWFRPAGWRSHAGLREYRCPVAGFCAANLSSCRSMSDESQSAWCISVRVFPAPHTASPVGWPIKRRGGAGGASTRRSSCTSWSPGCRGPAARITGEDDRYAVGREAQPMLVLAALIRTRSERTTTLCGRLVGISHAKRPIRLCRVEARRLHAARSRWSDAPDAGWSIPIEPTEDGSRITPAGMIVLTAQVRAASSASAEPRVGMPSCAARSKRVRTTHDSLTGQSVRFT